VVALVGYMFPVVRYLQRAEAAGAHQRSDRRRYIGRMLLGAALAGVALLGTWGSLQWAPKWAIPLSSRLPADGEPYHAKECTQIALACGAIVGKIIAALVAGRVGRRITYVFLSVTSFISLIYMYQGNTAFDTKMLVSVFFAGGATAAFYGWFPLICPNFFRRASARPAKGLPITSAACFRDLLAANCEAHGLLCPRHGGRSN
jgi:SHS family sialic acid transporter-like MFS transporter